jgi:hypothetical protein
MAEAKERRYVLQGGEGMQSSEYLIRMLRL